MTNQEPPVKEVGPQDQSWPWWPLLPLYPYGRKRTLFREIIPGQIWSFEQLQGLYYVAVPVRLTVVKVEGGLMLFNPLPPTNELKMALDALESKFGPVLSIVLPTASGLEHKISLPALSRACPKAELWVCPGQWTFPISLPSSWLGIPTDRTKVLLKDGIPHEECCEWISLGPIDIGLGRFQEIACFHKPSKALLVTDALVGIEAEPPEIFDFDPTPLLFHARESGDQLLDDSPENRRKGWARLVLFASFLRPEKLKIPSLMNVLKNAFKPGLRTRRAHFGLYPFEWKEGWFATTNDLLGQREPLLQVAPVLERLVFPRSKESLCNWLEDLSRLKGLRWLVSAHFTAPIPFSRRRAIKLKNEINKRTWASSEGNFGFLDGVDKTLLRQGVVPKDPLAAFRGSNLRD